MCVCSVILIYSLGYSELQLLRGGFARAEGRAPRSVCVRSEPGNEFAEEVCKDNHDESEILSHFLRRASHRWR